MFAALGGCVGLPWDSSKPMPDFSQRLPADLLERSDEVLVLVQTVGNTNPRGDSEISVDATFIKAYQLRTLNQKLTLSTSHDVGYFSVIGFIGEVRSGTRLDRICVLSGDGRVIELDFILDKDQVHALSQARREDIVAALRADASRALSKPRGDASLKLLADVLVHPMQYGPCAVTVPGAVTWDGSLRSRVADYISALPVWHP